MGELMVDRLRVTKEICGRSKFMILIFASSDSDWKYRASQRVEIKAIGTKEVLVKRRNREIREFFIEDLLNDFECDGEPSARAVKALKKRLSGLGIGKLYKEWVNDGSESGKESPDRWEMRGGQVGGDKGVQRLFCGGSEGESWVCSWTIIGYNVEFH